MSKHYDNWERLVAAVLRREQDRQIALSHSRDSSSIFSSSSSFNSLFYDQLPDVVERFSMMDYQETTTLRPSYLVDSFLDEKSGKKCYMVGAKDLQISSGNNPRNWKWEFDAHSRFSEVAELRSAWRLDIRARIEARMMQPRNVYAAYLVFKLADGADGLESAKGIIRFVNDESSSDAVKRGRPVHLQPVNEVKGEIAVERGDGWMEVEMGNFYIGEEDEGDVEARLLESRKWMYGLIVNGVVFRPTYTFIEAPLVSKQYLLRVVMY